MNRNVFGFIIILLSISACSTSTSKNAKKDLIRPEESFSYRDKNGQYVVKLTSGFNKKDNSFFTKKSLEIINKKENNALEQSVTISDYGSIKKKQVILRPKLSQYSVWFDGKKYFSEIKMNKLKKLLELKMISPESQWNGQKDIKLPTSKAMYCFFSQVIECAKTYGFFSRANKKDSTTMSFYIIWEGYPYLNETISDFPSELISRAELEFDGFTEEKERRFNLKVAGQSIFYVVDNQEKMRKMFWVSQGISMVSLSSKASLGTKLKSHLNATETQVESEAEVGAGESN